MQHGELLQQHGVSYWLHVYIHLAGASQIPHMRPWSPCTNHSLPASRQQLSLAQLSSMRGLAGCGDICHLSKISLPVNCTVFAGLYITAARVQDCSRIDDDSMPVLGNGVDDRG